MRVGSFIKSIIITTSVFVIMLGLSIDAKAEVKQIAQTSNSITVQWKKNSDISIKDNYYIGIAEYSDDENSYKKAELDAKSKTKAVNKNSTSYTIKDLKAGSKYYVCVWYEYSYLSDPGYYFDEYQEDLVKTLPGKVSGVNVQRWWRGLSNVTITWNTQSAVDDYEYEIYKGSALVASGNGFSTGDAYRVKYGTMYRARVRGILKLDNKTYYGPWSDKGYIFAQPTKKDSDAVKCSVKNGKMIVEWDKIKSVTGYEIYISSKPKTGFKKVKTVKGASKKSAIVSKFNKSSFKKNKTYYVYVKAYKNAGKNHYDSGLNYVTKVKGEFNGTIWVE